MNTEKSIKLMKVIKEILPEHYNFDFGKPEIDEVIKRLQMWEDFKNEYKNMFRNIDGGMTAETLKDMMDKYESEHLIIK